MRRHPRSKEDGKQIGELSCGSFGKALRHACFCFYRDHALLVKALYAEKAVSRTRFPIFSNLWGNKALWVRFSPIPFRNTTATDVIFSLPNITFYLSPSISILSLLHPSYSFPALSILFPRSHPFTQSPQVISIPVVQFLTSL